MKPKFAGGCRDRAIQFNISPEKNEDIMPSLTLFFIIQPPLYLYMACHLAASIRTHLPPEVEMIGYCPADSYDQMSPEPLEVLRRLRCKVVRMETDGYFDRAYPHGNKIIATLQPKETDYAAFLDSDMAFLRSCTVEELIAQNQVGMVSIATKNSLPLVVWEEIYGRFGIVAPRKQLALTDELNHEVVSYFDAGFIVTDENYRTDTGRRFGELWLETAQEIDRQKAISNRRPALAQITLPVATLRAGMRWNSLEQRYNYRIDGSKPLKKDSGITLLHYGSRDILGKAGCKKHLDDLLYGQLGTRRMRWIFMVPNNLSLQADPKIQSTEVAALKTAPDPSKALVAAISVADSDPARVHAWVDYYGAQLGLANLYLLAPAGDPRIATLPKNVNVIHIPKGADQAEMLKMMESFASGLTLYYNWIISIKPDEFLVVDPLQAARLSDYFSKKTIPGKTPRVVAPLGLKLVKAPDMGPMYARVSGDIQKPCITRVRISYAQGGRACNTGSIAIDPHLCLLKLPGIATPTLDIDVKNVVPVDTLSMAQQRGGLSTERSAEQEDFWLISPIEDQTIYRLPARCTGVLTMAKMRVLDQ